MSAASGAAIDATAPTMGAVRLCLLLWWLQARRLRTLRPSG